LYDNSQLSYSLVLNNQTRVGGPNGGRTGGGVTIATDGPSLLGCFVVNNLSQDQGGGLYFQGIGEVINCVINNNASTDGTNGGGGGVFFSQRGQLINCTVARNQAAAVGAGVKDDVNGGVIYNSVFWHTGEENQSGIAPAGLGTYDLQNFAGWGVFQSVTPVVDFATGANPSNCFEAPVNVIGNVPGMTANNIGNWLLKPSSPLIDEGNDGLNSEPLDIVKNVRKQGTIDIGAYEQTPVQVTSISITDTEHTFDGTDKGVSVTVTPDVSYIVEYREGTDSYSTTLPAGAGNYDVRVTITQQGYAGEETATLTINKASVSGVTFSDAAFDYDTSAKAIEISGGLPAGASVTYTDNTKTDAGTYNAVANIDGGDNYNNETLNADLTIHPKSLTVDVGAVSKTYDGTVTADIPTLTLSQGSAAGEVFASDWGAVDVSATGADYEDKNVGTNKTVNVSGIALSGTRSANYSLLGTAVNSTSTITPMPVTITVIAGQTKTYDKDPANPAVYTYTATSLPAGDTYEGALTRVPGENVDSYAIKQGSLLPATTGEASDGANYNVTFVSDDFVITAEDLTITGLTADDKVYDATANASFTGGTLSGVVAGDNVSFSYTAQFNNKNAGVNKPVTAAFSLSGGTELNNYSLTEPSGFSADITPRELVLFGFSIADRAPIVGDASADIESWGTLQTIPDPDIGEVSVKQDGVTASFPSDQAGTYTVTVSTLELEGVEALNYTLKQPVNLEATIKTDLPTFDWSAQSLETTYNGFEYPVAVEETHNNTVATVEYDHGDGNGWVSDVPIDAGSYLVRATSTVPTYVGDQTKTLTINKKAIPAATFGTGTKVYDNTTNVDPQPALVLSGIETRDEATVVATGSAAKYDTRNVGTNKTVTITDVTLSGAGAGNYTIPDVATNSTWSITKLDYNDVPLEFSFDDQEKVFDGTTSVKKDGVETIPSITISGFLAGDSFSATASSAAYDTPEAGSGKTVTLSGITYTNNATDNYDLPTELTNSNSLILKLSIDDLGGASMTIADQTKVYDGTTDVKDGSGNGYIPQVNFSGLITGFTDVTAVGNSTSYDDKNVGANKSVTVEGLTFGGTDAANYDFPSTVVNSNSSISPVSVSEIPDLEVVFDAQTKVYDGTTDVKDASGTVYVPTLTINGLITGDVVTATGTLATYDTKDAGDTKTVTITDVVYTGADAGNYVLPTAVAHNNSGIVRKPITIIPEGGQEKDFNDEEMNLDFEVEPRLLDNSLVIKDELTGELSWSGNRELGSYEILQGTITNENNPNYDIAFYQGITFVIGSDVNVIRKWGYMLLVNNADDAFVGYQWYHDGVEMPGEINQHYAPESKTLCGVYSCRVELADGTTIMSPDYEFLDGCGNAKSVSVFPNPVKSEEAIFVNQEGVGGFEEENGDYLLEIYSAQGQLVEWRKSTHLNRVKLSASASSGAYFVRISMDGKELGVIKMLVID
jgi:hypothetical protein